MNKKLMLAMTVTASLCSGSLWAQQGTTIIGQHDWLFYQYEMTDPGHVNTENTSLKLITRLNRQLRDNGIHLVVSMVPLKMRVYAEHLPDTIKISEYMRDSYTRMAGVLAAEQVHVVDLNTAFLTSPKRTADLPFFYRLDTHWAPSGAMLAAETIGAGIQANPDSQRALATVPEEKFNIAYSKRKYRSKGRDLAEQLPAGSPTYPVELVNQVNVNRAQPAKEDLLGNRLPVGVTLVGSSYSHEWTGFADALRYVLQRDVLSVSVGADRGSWVGMESYLRDDSFQTKAPALLLWELPERDMKAPPDYVYRDARYKVDSTEWLLRVSALVQTKCNPVATRAQVGAAGLAAKSTQLKGNDLVTGPTSEADFVEINLDKPLDKLDYLSAQLTLNGPKSISLEGSGVGVGARRVAVAVVGDDAPHAFKMPLPSAGKGFTKIRLFPGKSNGLVLQNLQICRQPENLLQ